MSSNSSTLTLFPEYSWTNIWNAVSTFGIRRKYLGKVFKDRENFDIKNYPEIVSLKTENETVFELLTKILTKDDDKRASIDGLLQIINDALNNINSNIIINNK